MTSIAILVASGVLALASAGTAIAAAQADLGGVICSIDVRETPGGVRLAGRAEAKSDLAGTYSFSVTKEDEGGASAISQGGAFHVGAGRPGVLNEVALSVSKSGSYRAELSLVWPGGQRSCERHFPSAG